MTVIVHDDAETQIRRLQERIDRLECVIHTAIEAMIKIAEAVDVLTDKNGSPEAIPARRSSFS
jgi:hypothetical protein